MSKPPLGIDAPPPQANTGMRWTQRHPELGQEPAPTAGYLDPDQFSREMDLIYRRTWLNVGRVEQAPEPGNFFTFRIPTFDIPIIVVHGKDGVIRAFYNVCSHRQFPVTLEASGKTNVFTCRLHSWSYDTSGNLVRAVDEHRFCNLDKAKLGLTPIACEVWNGFICVNLDPTPATSLAEHMAAATPYTEDFPFDEFSLAATYAVRDLAHWRVVMAAQMETWHVPHLHRGTIARGFQPGENFAATVEPKSMKLLGEHRVLGAPGPEARAEPLPTEALAAKYGPPSQLSQIGDAAATGGARRYKWGREFGEVGIFVYFPNWHTTLFSDSYMLFRYWPVSPTETLWEGQVYARPYMPSNAAELFALTYGGIAGRDTFREDAGAHPMIQRNMQTQAKSHVHYHDLELALRHLDHVVKQRTAPDKG